MATSETISDYRQQAREFLAKSRQYLADDDLHPSIGEGLGSGGVDGQGRRRGPGLGIRDP